MLKTFLTAALLAAASAGGASAESIAGLRWAKRIVIVFAAPGDRRIEAQKTALLEDTPALADRDLLAFAVVGDQIQSIYGEAPIGETAAALRERYDIADDLPFVAVLIGKDGGVKWRGERPIGAAELKGLIDAMPMRRTGG